MARWATPPVAEEPRGRRGLAQRDRAGGLPRNQRPGIVERREIEDVIVEGVGHGAVAEGAFEEQRVHPHVLPGRHHLPIPGQHGDDLAEHLAQPRCLRPELGVVAEDRRRLGRDPLGACAHAPVSLRELVQAGVGQDHADLGQIVEIDVESAEFAVEEGEGELAAHARSIPPDRTRLRTRIDTRTPGQAQRRGRRVGEEVMVLPTGLEPVFQP